MKYKNKLYMASLSYNRNVKVLNFTIFIYIVFIMFLKIEQVENLIITTMSLMYRNVPNGKYPYRQCIQMHNRLIVLFTEI